MEIKLSIQKSIVQDIRMSKLPQEIQEEQITSFKQNNKITSLALIFSAATSMIGTGILVYPLLYKENGMILSQIIVSLIGLISYKTATLCLIHVKDNEDDLSKVVLRKLGRNWHICYCLTGSVYLALTSGVYYLLILNLVYSLIDFMSQQISGVSLHSKDEFTFATFSFQWTNFICLFIFIIIVNLRSLKIVMKLGEYSFIGIIVFTIYCLVKSFINIDYLIDQTKHNPAFKVETVNLWSDKFAQLVGSCGVAYNIHNMVVPICQQSLNKKNNQRDLRIIYFIGFFIYTSIGILGYVAILNKPSNVKQPNTFMDYVPKNEIIGFIVDLFLLFKLCCVTPLYVYLCKVQLFELLYPNAQVPFWATQLFNNLYLIYIGIMGFYNVKPTTIYGFCGCYCGLILMYILPIFIHWYCLYKKPCSNEQSDQLNQKKIVESIKLDEEQDSNLIDGGVNKIKLLAKIQPDVECQDLDFKKKSKTSRYVFYGFLLAIGCVNSVLVIINQFQE